MKGYLGIDTSNYTTSTALYLPDTGEVRQSKRLLSVKEGAAGQRQGDAVFGHVKQLGELLEELLADWDGQLSAVGASTAPRNAKGSYMPCFLSGAMSAVSISAAARVPMYGFSHQDGHIAAALYGSDSLNLLEQKFLAFHVSGGTTQCLLVRPDKQRIIEVKTVGESLDLHAGQVVDRVGAMLGLGFPAGPALEELAGLSGEEYRPKPAMKGADCCLSGLQNLCESMLKKGGGASDVAKYCLCYLRETLYAMTEAALELHPGLPLVWAGGVMSNRFLQASLAGKYGGVFARAAYSADNAAGIALLCYLKHTGR